jgi:hypothetical protein
MITETKVPIEHIRQRIGQKVIGRMVPYPMINYACKFCKADFSLFEGKAGKNNVLPDKCENCRQPDCWEEKSRTPTSTIDDIINREIVYIAIDGKEFRDRLECDTHNRYIVGDRVEAYKCEKCGALHLENVSSCSCGSTDLLHGKLDI